MNIQLHKNATTTPHRRAYMSRPRNRPGPDNTGRVEDPFPL